MEIIEIVVTGFQYPFVSLITIYYKILNNNINNDIMYSLNHIEICKTNHSSFIRVDIPAIVSRFI